MNVSRDKTFFLKEKNESLAILFWVLTTAARAGEMPPVCAARYQYVVSYGEWELDGETWGLPFECADGTLASVLVNAEDLPKFGEAVYSVVSEKTIRNPFKKFAVPCEAMAEYCNYMTLQKYFGVREVFYQ